MQLLNLPSLLLTCGELAEDDPATSASVFALLCARLSEPFSLVLPARAPYMLAAGLPHAFNAAVLQQAQWAALLLAPLPTSAASGSSASTSTGGGGRPRSSPPPAAEPRRSLRLDPLGPVGAAAIAPALAALASRLHLQPLPASQVSSGALVSVVPARRPVILVAAGGGATAPANSGAPVSMAAAAAVAAAAASAAAALMPGGPEPTLQLTAGVLSVAVDTLLQVRGELISCAHALVTPDVLSSNADVCSGAPRAHSSSGRPYGRVRPAAHLPRPPRGLPRPARLCRALGPAAAAR